MTSPNADRPPEGRRFWKIAAITLGAGTLIVGTATIVGAWLFVNRGLTPLLERRLSKLLERQLELGELEGLSWNSLRVGPSQLSATATDPTYVTADAVEVNFSSLQVLFQRQLEIDLKLTGAEGYLEQHPDKGWIGIDVPTFEPVDDPLIKVRMDDIEVVDSQITLVPLTAEGADPTPLLMADLNGTVDIEPFQVNGQDTQRVDFEAIATPPNGGEIKFTGAVVPMASDKTEQPLQQEIKLGISGQGVAAEHVMAFLLPTLGQQNLPIAATAGRVSGAWTLSFLPDQPITVDGAGSVNQGQLQLSSLPGNGPWGNTIDNIDATARFKGTTITVDRAKGNYADIEATTTGTVDWNGDYDLIAQVPNVDLDQVLEQADINSPIDLRGVLDSTVAITGPMLQPQLTADVTAIGPLTVDRIVLENVTGEVVLASDRIENLLNTITVTQVSARPELGGQVTGSGVLRLANGSPELEFDAEVRNISGDAIASLYDVSSLPVTLSVVDATAKITGTPATLKTQINVQAPTLAYDGRIYPTTATAIFADSGVSIPQAIVQMGTGTLTGQGQVKNDSWQARILANNVNLQPFNTTLAGTLNANISLAGPIQGTTTDTLLAMGDYSLQFAEGSVQGDVELINGGWQTNASLNVLELSQFASQLRGNTTGTVSLSGQLNAPTLATIQGQGDLRFSAGLAGFSPQLAALDAPLSSRFAWTGQELLIEQASSTQLQARGVIVPQLTGNQFQGIRGFTLDLDTQRYPLALLPSPVPINGLASFNGRVMGTPSTPQVNGTLLLEDFGINQVAFDPVLLGPISYHSQTGLAVDLAGQSELVLSNDLADKIALNFQTPRDFNFDIQWQQAQATGHTDGDLLRTTLTNLPLKSLGLPAIAQLGGAPQGLLSSQGEWNIDLNRLTLTDAGVVIDQPKWGYVTAQELTATLSYQNQQLTVADGKLLLNPFLERQIVRERFFSACPNLISPPDKSSTSEEEGKNRENSYEIFESRDIVPETILETITQDDLSKYEFGGKVQLNTLEYEADIEVTQGDIKHLLVALAITELEEFFQLFQSSEHLNNAQLIFGNSDFLTTQAAGSFDDTLDPPQFKLRNQLLRLSEICALQEEKVLAEETDPIPSLDQLQGRFDATVSLSGRPQELPEVTFDVNGQDWSWGQNIEANRVIAQGQLTEGDLTLKPVRLETELPLDKNGNKQQAFVDLVGNLSLVDPEGSSLQLKAEQLPVAAVRDSFNLLVGFNVLPLGLEGRLNGIANFTGGLGNPTVRGNIKLANGSINNQPIEQADGFFLYDEARLALEAKLTQIDNPKPLLLEGNIPYAFPFMTVQPVDDQIVLTIDVADEGLALLNILNRQVIWESGQGTVRLNVGGRLTRPTISGVMNLRDTVLRSPLLPDPLTNFAGRIIFENNQIIVQELQGQYGNGRLQAIGSFPLGFPLIITGPQLAVLGDDTPEDFEDDIIHDTGDPDKNLINSDTHNLETDNTNTPNNTSAPLHPSGALTVTLDDIDLDLRGTYQGGVNGQIVVGGSLLLGGPQLGGVVELTDGRLFLPEGNTAPPIESQEIPLFVPRFENLKITLADNIQIQQSNLLNVVAQGDLRITGPLRPLRAIEPTGDIRLRRGRINLLTTTFRLAGRDNIARFTPERGIADPFLDLRLRTSVTETQQNNVVEATAFASSEIADSSIDPFRGTTGLETIRIQATYRGTASNLLESLFLSDISDTVIELSSSPPRSKQEIINLLSGSYVAALQSGQGVLNFFGGALLARVQDFVSRTLNLSEFRLFPVTGASQFSSDDNSGSTLDIATEVGFDVTDNITLSLVKILTDNTPTEFNLRYRLTDELTIRSTTNFDDRNRVLLEFETRF